MRHKRCSVVGDTHIEKTLKSFLLLLQTTLKCVLFPKYLAQITNEVLLWPLEIGPIPGVLAGRYGRTQDKRDCRDQHCLSHA